MLGIVCPEYPHVLKRIANKGIESRTQLDDLISKRTQNSIPGSKKTYSPNLQQLSTTLESCRAVFKELEDRIQGASSLVKSADKAILNVRVKPIWKSIKWRFKQDDIIKIRNELGHSKSTLSLCITIIIATPQIV